jgi:hypothetical protein
MAELGKQARRQHAAWTKAGNYGILLFSFEHDRRALHAHRLRGPARCARPSLTQKRGNILEKQVKDVYNNSARLKELMTASPMTAAQHAAINRKRIHDRRMLEDARERRSNANELF